MTTDLQRAAQQRVDRIAAFRGELAELEREGALSLTAEQRSALESHLDRLLQNFRMQFGAATTDSARRLSWAVQLGAVLFGAALFAACILFLHRIWGLLPWGIQVTIPIVSPLVLLGATELAARHQTAPYYVDLLAIASLAAFITGFNALTAIWNAAPSPHPFLAWATFALLVAYARRNRLLLSAGLVLGCVYVSALWVAWRGGFCQYFMERPYGLALAGVVVYAFAWNEDAEFSTVFHLCGAGAALIALLVLSESPDLNCTPVWAHGIGLAYQLGGLVIASAVVIHGTRLGQSALAYLGALGFIVFLYVRLHAWFWTLLPKYLFFLLIALITLGLVLVFRRVRRSFEGGAL